MTNEQRELLREHKMHSLLTLKQAKTLASQLEFDFERRDLDVSDSYYPQYDECIILKQDDQEVIVLGGRGVSYFGTYRRLFEIIEKHV